MLILKLNLPEATVTYNSVGVCTSVPVPHTPEKLKNTRLSLSITGYLCDEGFFAFRASCPEKPLVLAEQMTLLTKLGFRTVPTAYPPANSGSLDELIKTKIRFSAYDAEWYDYGTNEPYAVPTLAKIEDFTWVLDPSGRLLRRLITDAGEFDILDQRNPEYYQVGLQVKVWNGKILPYTSGGIVDPVLTHCPRCNNPLKRLQVAPDLPLILKCVSPVCKLMKEDKPLAQDIVKPEPAPLPIAPDPVEPTHEELVEAPIPVEESPAVEEIKLPGVLNLDNVTVPDEVVGRVSVYTFEDAEEFTPDFVSEHDVRWMLKRTKRSVTKISREVAERLELPLVTPEELVEIVKEG